jgi:hypothetical protein
VAVREDQFVLSAAIRVFGPIASVLLILLGGFGGVFVVASGAPLGFSAFWVLWFVGVVAQSWWFFFWMPQRIEVSDAGLRFVARRRVLDVPWAGLRTVVIPMLDFPKHHLIWRWDGGRVRTWRRFDGMDRLLGIVEQRAPEAKLLL